MFHLTLRHRTLAASLFFLFLAGPSRAQDESPELVTDRPDQTESASTVPEGFVQLEIGGLVSRRPETFSDVDVVEVPGTLVRVGLSPNWELRAGWAGYVSIDGRFADADGTGDGDIGFKYRFRHEKGSSPEMAVLISTSVPFGDEGITSDGPEPELRLAFSHTLSERLSLGYNVGLAWEAGDDFDNTTLYDYIYTVALGIGLGERVGAFVELFGDVPGNAPGDPAHSFDGGFTFLVRDNVQLDVAGGVGLNDTADDWFAGMGISVRFPH